MITDRYPVVLQGLTSLFAAQYDFKIVASCSDGASCIKAVRDLVPDVAILDVSMPDLTGPSVGCFSELHAAAEVVSVEVSRLRRMPPD